MSLLWTTDEPKPKTILTGEPRGEVYVKGEQAAFDEHFEKFLRGGLTLAELVKLKALRRVR